MKNFLNKIKGKIGCRGLLTLLVSPLLVVITTPYRFFQVLRTLLPLANGCWQQYNRFSSARALNSLFYWTQAVNIERYSLLGTSPTIGNGEFLLSRWFHLSLPSIILYWRLGAVAPIIGMFGWILFHFVWLEHAGGLILALVLTFLTLSSTFYASVFEQQNYNAFGWMFFPLGIWGFYTDNYVFAALAWLLCSFGGFTSWFTGGVLSFSLAVSQGSILPVVAMLPSSVKMLTHFHSLYTAGILKEQISSVAKGIGVVKGRRKLVRKKSLSRYIQFIYFGFLYGQYLLCSLWMGQNVDLLYIAMLILFTVNTLQIIRYADPGSILVPVATIATAMLLQNFSLALFISWLFLINPIALFLDFADNKLNLVVVPPRKPFKLASLQAEMDKFFKEVEPGARVLFSFNDPSGQYESVFDGYRNIHELALYSASLKGFHLLPDWYLVFEYNASDVPPSFFGRDKEDIAQNMRAWGAKYLVFYDNGTEEMSELVEFDNYRLVEQLDWQPLIEEFDGDLPIHDPNLKWFLLEYTNVPESRSYDKY